MLLLLNVSSREWVEKGGGIIIAQLHLLKFLWKFNRRGSAFRGTLFHIRKLLITCRNGSNGVHNPKWWIIQTPFTFAFEMYFWTWIWIEIWYPRSQRVLSFLSYLYTLVFKENKKIAHLSFKTFLHWSTSQITVRRNRNGGNVPPNRRSPKEIETMSILNDIEYG